MLLVALCCPSFGADACLANFCIRKCCPMEENFNSTTKHCQPKVVVSGVARLSFLFCPGVECLQENGSIYSNTKIGLKMEFCCSINPHIKVDSSFACFIHWIKAYWMRWCNNVSWHFIFIQPHLRLITWPTCHTTRTDPIVQLSQLKCWLGQMTSPCAEPETSLQVVRGRFRNQIMLMD